MPLLTPSEKLLILESKCLPQKEAQRIADILRNKFRLTANRQNGHLIPVYLTKIVIDEGKVDRTQVFIRRIARILGNVNTDFVAKEVERALSTTGVYEFKIPANLVAKAKELAQQILNNGFSFTEFKQWLGGAKAYKEDADDIMATAGIDNVEGLYTQLLGTANEDADDNDLSEQLRETGIYEVSTLIDRPENDIDKYRNYEKLVKYLKDNYKDGVDFSITASNDLRIESAVAAADDSIVDLIGSINEARMQQIKRPYKRGGIELKPAVNVAQEAVLRNKIVRFLGEQILSRASKTAINEFFNSLNEDLEIGRRPSNSWLYRNTHLVKRIKVGKEIYYKLTRAGVNLYNKIKTEVNEVVLNEAGGDSYEIHIESDDDTIAELIAEFETGLIPDNVAPAGDNAVGIVVHDEDERRYVDGVLKPYIDDKSIHLEITAFKHERPMALKSHEEMMNEGTVLNLAGDKSYYLDVLGSDKETKLSIWQELNDLFPDDTGEPDDAGNFRFTVSHKEHREHFDNVVGPYKNNKGLKIEAWGKDDRQLDLDQSRAIMNEAKRFNVKELFDIEKTKKLIADTPEGETALLLGHYSINVQSKYEDGEDLQNDLDELEEELGVTLSVNDYDDLIADPHGVMNESEGADAETVTNDQIAGSQHLPKEVQSLLVYADELTFTSEDPTAGIQDGTIVGTIKGKKIFTAKAQKRGDEFAILNINGAFGGKTYKWNGQDVTSEAQSGEAIAPELEQFYDFVASDKGFRITNIHDEESGKNGFDFETATEVPTGPDSVMSIQRFEIGLDKSGNPYCASSTAAGDDEVGLGSLEDLTNFTGVGSASEAVDSDGEYIDPDAIIKEFFDDKSKLVKALKNMPVNPKTEAILSKLYKLAEEKGYLTEQSVFNVLSSQEHDYIMQANEADLSGGKGDVVPINSINGLNGLPKEIQEILKYAEELHFKSFDKMGDVINGFTGGRMIFTSKVEKKDDNYTIVDLHGRKGSKTILWNGEDLKVQDRVKEAKNQQNTITVERPTKEQIFKFQALQTYLKQNYHAGKDYNLTPTGTITIQKGVLDAEKAAKNERLSSILKDLDVIDPKSLADEQGSDAYWNQLDN